MVSSLTVVLPSESWYLVCFIIYTVVTYFVIPVSTHYLGVLCQSGSRQAMFVQVTAVEGDGCTALRWCGRSSAFDANDATSTASSQQQQQRSLRQTGRLDEPTQLARWRRKRTLALHVEHYFHFHSIASRYATAAQCSPSAKYSWLHLRQNVDWSIGLNSFTCNQ